MDTHSQETFTLKLEQLLEEKLVAYRQSGLTGSLLLDTLRATSRPLAAGDPLLTGIWFLTLEQFVIKHKLVPWADSDEDLEADEAAAKP